MEFMRLGKITDLDDRAVCLVYSTDFTCCNDENITYQLNLKEYCSMNLHLSRLLCNSTSKDMHLVQVTLPN